MQRREAITSGCVSPIALVPGMELRILVSGEVTHSVGLCTCAVTFAPGVALAYHRHPCSEAITAVHGRAVIHVEGRQYEIEAFDCIHIPAGVVHAVRNASLDVPALLHTAFASAAPTREFAAETFEPHSAAKTDDAFPEHFVRQAAAAHYELASGTRFCDLFAGRMGAHGICGGYGVFRPGAGLPCHYHDFDESITIVAGTAICQVAGREYALANMDTACVPRGRPHRFLNRSNEPMAMIWVYAGDEPDRVIVEPGLCDGTVPFEEVAAATCR